MTCSVIVPMYNAENWIGRALRSVAAQTVPPDEIVCVDDGSQDRTVERVRELAPMIPVPIRILQQPNSGAAAARNAGIQEARGDALAFLDSDDQWLPDKLARQLPMLGDRRKGHTPVVAVTSDVRLRGRSTGTLARRVHRNPAALDGMARARQLYLGRFNMFTSSLVVTASQARRLGGFDDSLKQREDHLFLLALLSLGDIVHIRRPLAVYNRHPDSLRHAAKDPSRIWGFHEQFRLRARRVVPELRAMDRRLDARIHRTIANSMVRAGCSADALREIGRALMLDPTSAATWLSMIRCIGERARVAAS